METGQALVGRIEKALSADLFDDFAPRAFESRVIAEHVTGDAYATVLVSTYDLNDRQKLLLEHTIGKRNSGMPLAYVTHEVTFRQIDLFVDERVLIPRVETEIVVEHALRVVNEIDKEFVNVVDIGTGSGAIALSIAHECSRAHVVATDISHDAIQVARLNAMGLGSAGVRVEFCEGDLCEALPQDLKGNVDVLISNPPYIGEDERDTLDASVLSHEPHNALFSGDRGEDHYRSIVNQSKDWLTEKGVLILEISPRHHDLMGVLAEENGFESCELYVDLTGRERVCIMSL